MRFLSRVSAVTFVACIGTVASASAQTGEEAIRAAPVVQANGTTAHVCPRSGAFLSFAPGAPFGSWTPIDTSQLGCTRILVPLVVRVGDRIRIRTQREVNLVIIRALSSPFGGVARKPRTCRSDRPGRWKCRMPNARRGDTELDVTTVWPNAVASFNADLHVLRPRQ